MRKLVVAILLAASLTLCAEDAMGWKQVVYQLEKSQGKSLTQLAPAYSNLGYDQSAASDQTLRVRVDLTPLSMSGPVPTGKSPAAQPQDTEHLQMGPIALGSILGKLDAVRQQSKTLYQALDHTLSLAGEAFPKNRPDCVKRAELAVYLLHQLGIEARTVTGIRMQAQGATALEGAALHRWVEIHLPNQGWVFSDPGQFHFFVPPEYIFLGPTRSLAPDTFRQLAGGQVVRLFLEGALAGEVTPEKHLRRTNQPKGGLLMCRLEGFQTATLWLEPQSKKTGNSSMAISPVDGWAAFGPLPAGTYKVHTSDRAWRVGITENGIHQVVLK